MGLEDGDDRLAELVSGLKVAFDEGRVRIDDGETIAAQATETALAHPVSLMRNGRKSIVFVPWTQRPAHRPNRPAAATTSSPEAVSPRARFRTHRYAEARA
jgi:hypothetical protein